MDNFIFIFEKYSSFYDVCLYIPLILNVPFSIYSHWVDFLRFSIRLSVFTMNVKITNSKHEDRSRRWRRDHKTEEGENEWRNHLISIICISVFYKKKTTVYCQYIHRISDEDKTETWTSSSFSLLLFSSLFSKQNLLNNSQ